MSLRPIFPAIVALAAAAVAGAEDLDAFGRCLARNGAVFYGASWCPQCARQEALLGDAMEHVTYVECSEGGRRQETPDCADADIHGYPTWQFRDGSRARGVQSLAELARHSGCRLSSEGAAAAAPPRRPAGPRRTRPQSDGPLIIDVR